MDNKNTELFPQGIATGKAFCDRDNERGRLKHSFNHNQHTVVVAPRRYGKSSLIKQVMLETKMPGKRIDLLPSTNIGFIQRAVNDTVLDILNQIAPRSQKAKTLLMETLKKLHPKLTISLLGQKLEISSSQTPEGSISELLVGLNSVAENLKKRVVICFDEFQQVGMLKEHNSIEASIRHAAESSSYVTYVFSGSSRHLLNVMFNSKSRPLYHLCDLLKLTRIDEATYFQILLQRASAKWGRRVEQNAIKEILLLTKCHSFYVNALCRILWAMPLSPTVQDVQREWLSYIEGKSSWISQDVSSFTPNQRNVIAAIAYSHTLEPYSHEFSKKVAILPASIRKSIDFLMREDYIYRDDTGIYKVLDPAMEFYLHRVKHFDFIS